jgi:gluconolactonase
MLQAGRFILGSCLLFSFSLAAQSPAPPAAPGAAPAAGQGGGRGRGPQAPLPFEITRLDPALDQILPPDTKLDTIVAIPGVSGEGPMWREGKLWFSDQKGGDLYTVTPDGKTQVIAEMAGGPINPAWSFNQGPNAQVTDKDGTMLICRQAFRDIGRFQTDGTAVEFLSHFEGKRLNAPNDLVFGPDGALWFTDPAFSVPGAQSGGPVPEDSQLPIEGVYRYKNGQLARVISDITRPNGIGLSPDGKILYVNSSSAANIRAFDIAVDDSLSNERIFTNFGVDPDWRSKMRGYPDGLKVDSRGNVWSTGPGGINIIAPDGKVLGRIQLPLNASNLAFGSSDLHSVYFTAGTTIYRIHSLVAGEKPLNFRP